jgi:hypothetical protein
MLAHIHCRSNKILRLYYTYCCARYTDTGRFVKHETRSTNRCLRISSHRSTMFNNPAARGRQSNFTDFAAKLPRSKFLQTGRESVRARNLSKLVPKVNRKKQSFYSFFRPSCGAASAADSALVIRRASHLVKTFFINS